MIGKAIAKFYSSLKQLGSGVLSVEDVTNYESLVVADDDLTNKKYVDDTAVAKANIAAKAFAGGLKASLIANGGVLGGNLGRTVQIVMQSSSGVLQVGSADDNNEVVIFSSGTDFSSGTEKNRINMNKGEIHVETSISAGAVLVSTKGVLGYSDIGTNGPITTAPEGFADTIFFLNIFRNASAGNNIFVAAGAVASDVEVRSGDGLTLYDSASLEPYGLATLSSGTVDGEYRVVATEPVFVACRGSANSDARLVPPLATDLLGQNRNAEVSALYANTEVWWYRHTGNLGKVTVSPGSPVQLYTGTINELGDVFILGSNAVPGTGGTFTVTINGAVTPAISYDAGVKVIAASLPLSTLVGAYTVTAATITNNTTDVTVTHTAHGLSTGANVRVSNTSDALILPNGDYDNITVIDANSYTISYVPTGGTTGTADLVDYSYPYVAADFKVEAIVAAKLNDASAQIIVYCMGNLARVAGSPSIDTTGMTGNPHTLTMYQSGTAENNAGSHSGFDPPGCIRLIASAGISCFAGADAAGGEAVYFYPISALSQRIPLTAATVQTGNPPQSSITVQSAYRGHSDIYRTDGSLVYEFNFDRDSGITVDSEFKQRFPTAYQVTGTGGTAVAGIRELFTEDFLGGYLETDVPCVVIMNSDDNEVLISGGIPTFADETVHYGITPEDVRAEIRKDSKGVLRKRVIDSTGTETWELV